MTTTHRPAAIFAAAALPSRSQADGGFDKVRASSWTWTH